MEVNQATGMSKIGGFLDSIFTSPIRNLFTLFGIYDPLPRGIALGVLVGAYLFISAPGYLFTPSGKMRGFKVLDDLGFGDNDPDNVYFPYYVVVYLAIFFFTYFI